MLPDDKDELTMIEVFSMLPELDNIIAGWSLGHSAFFHFRTVRPRHRARFPDDFRLVSLQREGAA